MTTATTPVTAPTAASWAPTGAREPAAVPWSTVIPLALPLGCAAAFWTVALRTSLGSIARASSPTASWVRETALFLPLFVLAVLAALTLVQRRFGPELRGFRQVGAASLLVAGFGTVAGALELAGNSVYDYHLQVGQLAMMNAMRDDCSASCQSAQLHATLHLQERSVLIGLLVLLVTNLVVVAWVVALRGGRLRLASAHPARRSALDRLGMGRMLLVSTLVGSAVVHVAVVPEHRAEWALAAVFFVLLTAVELGLAALVVVRRDRLVLVACAVVSVATLLLWFVSRTWGLPFGPEAGEPEAIGMADVAACALELVTALAAIALLRPDGDRAGPRPAVHGIRLVLVLVIAVTALGVGGSSLHGVGLGAGEMAMDHAATAADGG